MYFASAYRQLSPVEKDFADRYVAGLERAAVRSGTRLAHILDQPMPIDDLRERELLGRPLVRAAVAERVRELADAMDLSAHRVLKELASIAFSSVADYMRIDEFGAPVFDLTKCTPEQLRAVASIEIEDSMRGTRKFKFKLHDKLGGLKEFMAYMGLRDPSNPHWRMETAKPANADALPADITTEDAESAYARMING